ncbi:Fimbria adhesin protein precursor [Pseudomonas sp. THAF187a]|uniref:fimbrial protein n=1 Tax=unclassified Pseudomonas TaxID=196821 RepID=UPI001268718D|nr:MULTISPECIES: fimbrial protein [unclassified Pseudomonas]QFT20400.1 Fimbria adhesin protein precursor [Pseudomonas sp. THAF187a]QFT40590.1 Fimbria adhesin protein precursor [Pseudomonas sp. THAF42]
MIAPLFTHSLFRLLWLTALVSVAPLAHATCLWERGFDQGVYAFNFPTPITVPAGPLQIGQVLAESRQPVRSPFYLLRCLLGKGYASGTFVAESSSTMLPGVYRTHVQGVGYRVSLQPEGLYAGSEWQQPIPFLFTGMLTAQGWRELKLELVATSTTLGAGMITPGNYASLRTAGYNRYLQVNIQSAWIAPPPSSCRLFGNPDQTVTLAPVSRNRFSGVGSTQGEQSFDIVLQCENVVNGVVRLRMDGTPHSSNAPGVLALTSGAAATGVGLQLLDGTTNAPVELGQPKQLAGLTRGLNTLPYRVRYYQASTQVGAGAVLASVTLTLTYL